MLLPDGATVVPIILSTDKTQLCVLSGGKTTYPVYMTIGNIDKTIQRKPSYHSQAIVGYLPTTTFSETDLDDTSAWLAHSRLFHRAMGIIFAPLKAIAKSGIELTSGDGSVQCGHPILACYIADYPEQSLVACTRYGVSCPKCYVRFDDLGDRTVKTPRHQNETLRKIHNAREENSKTKINAKL